MIYALAIAFLAGRLALFVRRGRWEPATAFVLATAVLSSLAILAIPRATRIHHALGAYPFPQYVVALAILGLAGSARQPARRAAAAGIAALALGGSAWASWRTFDTIQSSHGKGRWSDATQQLAVELAEDPGAIAVSLDWGFRAQLRFLDRGLEIREPVWEITRRSPRRRPLELRGRRPHALPALGPGLRGLPGRAGLPRGRERNRLRAGSRSAATPIATATPRSSRSRSLGRTGSSTVDRTPPGPSR